MHCITLQRTAQKMMKASKHHCDRLQQTATDNITPRALRLQGYVVRKSAKSSHEKGLFGD